jgi:hypothetical protein
MAELADWDKPLLATELQGLAELGVSLEDSGFGEADLASLLAETKEPDAPEDFPEVGEGIDTEFKCPRCGYEWSGQPR